MVTTLPYSYMTFPRKPHQDKVLEDYDPDKILQAIYKIHTTKPILVALRKMLMEKVIMCHVFKSFKYR